MARDVSTTKCNMVTQFPIYTTLPIIRYSAMDKEIQENLAIEDADCEGTTSTTLHLHALNNGKFQFSVANAGDSKCVLMYVYTFQYFPHHPHVTSVTTTTFEYFQKHTDQLTRTKKNV